MLCGYFNRIRALSSVSPSWQAPLPARPAALEPTPPRQVCKACWHYCLPYHQNSTRTRTSSTKCISPTHCRFLCLLALQRWSLLRLSRSVGLLARDYAVSKCCDVALPTVEKHQIVLTVAIELVEISYKAEGMCLDDECVAVIRGRGEKDRWYRYQPEELGNSTIVCRPTNNCRRPLFVGLQVNCRPTIVCRPTSRLLFGEARIQFQSLECLTRQTLLYHCPKGHLKVAPR